ANHPANGGHICHPRTTSSRTQAPRIHRPTPQLSISPRGSPAFAVICPRGQLTPPRLRVSPSRSFVLWVICPRGHLSSRSSALAVICPRGPLPSRLSSALAVSLEQVRLLTAPTGTTFPRRGRACPSQ
ncbi:unnamed protein product, partial [Heterosigma akashiwo]